MAMGETTPVGSISVGVGCMLPDVGVGTTSGSLCSDPGLWRAFSVGMLEWSSVDRAAGLGVDVSAFRSPACTLGAGLDNIAGSGSGSGSGSSMSGVRGWGLAVHRLLAGWMPVAWSPHRHEAVR